MASDDVEQEVASLQSRMTPLAKTLYRIAGRALDALRSDIEDLMRWAGYDRTNAVVILNGPADAGTIKRLTDLAEAAPHRYRKTVRESIVRQIAEHRMTRRLAIQRLAQLNMYAVLDDMTMSAGRILSTVAEEGYYRGTFVLQKEAGRAWSVDGLSNARIQNIVNSKFSIADARRFMDPLIKMSSHDAIYAMLQGLPPEQVSSGVAKVKAANLFRSKREARTKVTETNGEAHQRSYSEAGVKRYQFVATFDERTCPVCGRLDAKRFPVSEAKPGVNYPPMHPNCRCTTIAVMSKEIEALMAPRTIVDTATGEVVTIPREYSYEQWYREYGPGRTDGKQYVPKKR